MKNKISHGAVVGLLTLTLTIGTILSPFGLQRAHADVSPGELINLLVALNIIPKDKATLARSVLENQSPTATVCPYTWNRNLTVGTSGSDVLALQRFLNADTVTRIASTGAGSPGAETQIFGQLTADAVKRFQNKHASEVLTPVGLMQGTGYVGASTRVKLNALCSKKPVVTPKPTTPSVTPTTPAVVKDEADVVRYKLLNSPSNEDVEEQEAKDVFAVQFEVKDAAVTLSRMEVAATAAGIISERRPWNLLRELSVYDGSTKISSVRVDTKEAWSSMGGDQYKVRFPDLSRSFSKGDKPVLTVRAEVQRSIDSRRLPQDIELWIPEKGLRFRDGAGIDHYLGSNDERENMIVQKAGQYEELVIRQTKDNPVETTFKVRENRESSEYTLLKFELDAQKHNIEIEELPITVYTYNDTNGSVSYNSVVQDIWLNIDSLKYDDIKSNTDQTETLDGYDVTATTIVFDLDRNKIQLDKDTKTPVQVLVKFRKQNGNYEQGQQIRVDVTRDNVNALIAEGANTLTDDRKNGQAIGSVHGVRTQGTLLSSNALVATAQGKDRSRGEYSISFAVTAFENDFYIPFNASFVDGNGTVLSGSSDGGVRYRVLASSVTSTGTVSAVLTSKAKQVDSAYLVREGTTETFTLNVQYDPEATDYYLLVLDSIGFRTLEEANSEATYVRARPEQQFTTEYVYVQG